MKPQHPENAIPVRQTFHRRNFLAVSSPLILSAATVRGSQANSRINIGLIGCGGRGTWIANLFQKHGGYQFTACADYFQDRVDQAGEKLAVPAGKRFTGLSGYQKLLQSKPDAVAIESPPYFHPIQAEAAVEAGAHVFLAKPIAVDVTGCRKVAEAGKKAQDKKLVFWVDFQTRTDPFYQEAVKRSQYGDIGRIICGEATYITGPTWGKQADWLKDDPKNSEARLRAWGLDRALSGDIITEQNIHALDVAAWILDAEPVFAVGTGGRKLRMAGDVWDYFSVIYHFPSDVVLTFCSKQLGQGWEDICCRMYGSDGTIDTHYFGDVSIRGKMPYKGGKMDNLFTRGAEANIASFHTAVTGGRSVNPTVANSVRSNLITILGRQAAYKNGRVTWDEMMRSGEVLDPKLAGLKA